MRRNQALEKARRVRAEHVAAWLTKLLDILRERGDVDAARWLADKGSRHRARQLASIAEEHFEAYFRQRHSGRTFTSLRRLAALAALEETVTKYGRVHGLPTLEAIQDARRRELMPPARTCRVCGRADSTRWRWRLYCSQRCADAAWTMQRRKRRAQCRQRACACCGVLYEAQRADGLYCSGRCRQRAYRARELQARWTAAVEEEARA